jgi:hypothetical protein
MDDIKTLEAIAWGTLPSEQKLKILEDGANILISKGKIYEAKRVAWLIEGVVMSAEPLN